MSGGWLGQNATRIAAGAFAAFGVFWMFAAARQTYFVDTPYISLSFLPFASGAILTLLAGYLAIFPPRSTSQPADQADESDVQAQAEARGHKTPQGRGLVRVALALVALLIFAVLMPRVHAFVTLFALVLAGLVLTGEPLRPKLFLIAALVAGLLFLVFVTWLGVPLPGGRFT